MVRRTSRFFAALFGAVSLVALGSVPACGGNNNTSGFGSSSGGGAGSGGSNGSSGGSNGSSGGGSNGSSGGFGSTSSSGGGGNTDGGVACPSGLQCNVSCSNGGTTSISGKVYDPAGNDPLYDIAVYVPAVPLVALPKGVPTGSDACSCAALFKSGAVVSAVTGVDGAFKLSNAPVGSNVPLVLQVGKWRRLVKINTTACQDNAQPDKSLTLPATVASGDTDDNMPDIAVSTGSADSLECLMHRIGLPLSEFSGGAGGAGHVHVFAGGGAGGGGGGGGGVGRPESPAWANATPSDTSLWDSQQHMMPYDITLLSCEGGETYNADPAVLESYLNAGGRAFGSHFHYAWFSGPIGSGQAYSAPTDWGNNLATWSANGGGIGQLQANGKIVQTLNGSTMPFAKGIALFQWLGLEGALGVNGAPAMELPIQQPRFNAVVGPGNKPSQQWIQDDATPNTMYFSFDTPVNAPPNPDGGPPNYCGRAVFSDLHVSGNTKDPGGTCNDGLLQPQEKALEFMLFDLSSCVIPDTIPPSDAGIPIAN
ncbi:MAG TPA: hypothetical protein VF765_38530 [Polyangiaceae bacterium]